MSEPERKARCDFSEKRTGTLLGLFILDGQVDGPGPPVDGNIEVVLASLTVAGLLLGQMPDIDANETEIIIPEGALPSGRLTGEAD